MYAVRTWASWALRDRSPFVPTLWATFDLRGAAFEAGDSVPYPIVSIIDIGREGYCPARPSIPQRDPDTGEYVTAIQGHSFDRVGENAYREGVWECRFCHAWQSELYIEGTLIAREADNDLMGGPGTCECCGSPQVYTHGLCAWCIERCAGQVRGHVSPPPVDDGHDCNLHR
jgi:hypothetical protein